MKILYFRKDGQPALGVVKDNFILDVDAWQTASGGKIFAGRNLNNDDVIRLKQIIAD